MPSLYLLVFGLVGILTLITMVRSQLDKPAYVIGFSAMTLLLVLRFGQGTDYPGYMYIYEMTNMLFDPKDGFGAYMTRIHSEIGWKFLMIFFQLLKTDFRVVVIILSLSIMWCTNLGINRFCEKHKTLALFILYPTIYLTYYFSAMRQGIAMAIFFGVLLDKLLKKNYVQYIIGVILISTIHSASLCYLILPIALKINKKTFGICIVSGVLFSIAMIFDPIREVIKNIAVMAGASAGYFGTISLNWFSLVERTLMLSVIIVLISRYKDNCDAMNRIAPILRIYIIGFLVYICLFTNAFVSSRLAAMFKMSEFILIPMMIEEIEKKVKYIYVICLVCITSLIVYKNMNSYVAQGKYYESINGWNFPYVTIFNKEDILKYREEFTNDSVGFKESDYLK